MNIQPNTTISGRYTILEKIGVGGMANVYKAKDEKLNRFVTFKVLKEEHIENTEFINRFAVEAQAAARLSHPNIVNVYDVGNEGNINYIVMEYIDGITLKELIKKKAPFDNQEALSVAIQIASALEEAHTHNIVHRDIKPHNILITREGDIKVTDFGIARAATSTTVNVESMGSVHYFSPEQARGGFVDFKSDIYSLGIVLFEMITGRLPFQGDTPVALAMKHLREPIPDVRRINPNVSESVYKIIIKATQKISAKRYQTMEEMNRDLKRATKNESGDFVVFEEEDVTSQTIRVTGEELNEIKKNSRNNNLKNNNYADDYDDYDDYDYSYENRNKKPIKNRNNYSLEEKKNNKKAIFAALGTSFALILLITISTFAFFGSKEGEVKVPDFTGETWEDALIIADENKIYIKPDKEKPEDYSEDFEKDLIMKQNVEAGEYVKEGDTIYLVKSLGSKQIEIPDLVGENLDDAVAKLSKLGVKWSEKWEYSDDIEKLSIIRQDPESGEKILRDDKVTLYISKGKESDEITIPNVIGYSKEDAESKLSEKGFDSSVEYVESSKSEGIVVDQSIESGEKREAGTNVIIYVSKGEKVEEENNEENNNSEDENSENNNSDGENSENNNSDSNNSNENDNQNSNVNSNDSENQNSNSDSNEENPEENQNVSSNNNSSENSNSNNGTDTNTNSDSNSNNNTDNSNANNASQDVTPKKVDEVEIDPSVAQ